MGVREILLIALIAGLCVAALFRPKVGLLSCVWYTLMRPDFQAYVPERYPFSLLLLLATTLGSFPHLFELPRIFKSRFVLLLMLLQVPIFLSVIFALNSKLAFPRWTNYLKMVVGILLIPFLIRTANDVVHLLFVFCLSLDLLALKYGGYSLVHGGASLRTNDFGRMYDNNTFALMLVTTIPVCWYLLENVSGKLRRFGILVLLASAVITVIFTNSRGSALGMGVALLLLILRSKHRLAALGAIGLSVGMALFFVYDQYTTRLSTIADPTQENSSNSRLELAQVALKIARQYPLLGVGFGGQNFAAAAEPFLPERYVGATGSNIHVVHNTYLGMLTDSGVFALLLFGGILFGQIFWLRRSARLAREYHPDLEWIPLSLQISLVGFAVGAVFYSLQAFDPYYVLVMVIVAWELAQRDLIQNSEPEDADLSEDELDVYNLA